MVLEMIALESDSEGNADGQVGHHAQGAVGQRPLHAEASVVRDLVHAYKDTRRRVT